MKDCKIRAKKIGAGQYEITVVKNYESKTYIENDMTIIDSWFGINDNEENFYTEAEAVNLIISKAGF